MNIILLNPRVVTTPAYPLGIMYIAAVLGEKHKVRMIDSIDDAGKIADEVLSENPDMVGISVATPQYPKAVDIANEINSKTKSVTIVMGGIHTTAAPESVLSNKNVDYVVVGEGELTFKQLADYLSNPKGKKISDILGIGYKRNGRIRFNKPRPLIEDLDKLPLPAYHLLETDIYFKPPKMRGTWSKMTGYVMASRGCPYHCIYCASHLLFGRKVRRRSVENVLGEIEYLRKTKGVTAIYFLDDTFTTDAEWVKDFCRELIKRKWKGFEWGCQARVNTVLDFKMLQLMKKSKCCQVDIGIESGSQKVLNIMKKGIAVEQIYKAFDLLKKAKLRTFTSWIIGTPGETKEDMKETLKVLERIKPDYADFNFLVPYPGTELAEKMVHGGANGSKRDYENYILHKLAERPVVSYNNNMEEMIRFKALLYRKSIVRNYLSMIRNPSNMLGILKIFMKGFGGLRTAIPKFMRDGNVDDIVQGMLVEYRRKEMLKEKKHKRINQ